MQRLLESVRSFLPAIEAGGARMMRGNTKTGLPGINFGVNVEDSHQLCDEVAPSLT